MLLNLSGAHGPFFTRNLIILTDSDGQKGIGEVPGGEKIRKTIEDATQLVVGQSIVNVQSVLTQMRTCSMSLCSTRTRILFSVPE